jgi:hypothetical protein
MMGHRGHGSDDRRLLATTHRSSGDEDASVLAPITTRLPDASGLVPERLPLGREVAVTGWDAEEEGIVFLKRVWVAEDGDTLVFGRSIHFLQNLIGESLFDLVEVALAAGLFDAFGFRLWSTEVLVSYGQDEVVRANGKR